MCVKRHPSKSQRSSELPFEPSLTFAIALFAVMKLVSAASFWFDTMCRVGCSSKVDRTAWNPRTWHSLQ